MIYLRQSIRFTQYISKYDASGHVFIKSRLLKKCKNLKMFSVIYFCPPPLSRCLCSITNCVFRPANCFADAR